MGYILIIIICCVVESLSHAQLFATPWTTAHQPPQLFSISWSLCKFMSVESVMLTISSSVAPLFPCPQSFPVSGSFLMSQLFAAGGQSIGTSASASVLPMKCWFPLRLTGLILLSMGLSRIFRRITVQKYQFFSAQPSLWSNSRICTWLLGKKTSFDYTELCQQVMSLLFNMLCRFVITFLPRSIF